jgi:K+-transporting ATPase ATPase B chain
MLLSEKNSPFFSSSLLREGLIASFKRLNPCYLFGNPVMFVVWLGSLITTVILIYDLMYQPLQHEPFWFTAAIACWLWFTVLFANFSEAVAEGRGKAHATALRALRQETMARRLDTTGHEELVSATSLKKGDLLRVSAGEFVPADGEIIEGIASIDESAITGESAPVIRESSSDFCAVTGGTKVLSNEFTMRVTLNPGETFLDQMISLVQAAKRQRTPNELALHMLLVGLTFIFLFVCVTLVPFTIYSKVHLSLTVIVALLVCLIPTTIGGLLSAIGIAGIERALSKNVLAMSGKAIETAGDIDVLLLDKTGTITLGNRMASQLIAFGATQISDLARVAELSSLADDTPEGRSIVQFVQQNYGKFSKDINPHDIEAVPFSAETRMSGCTIQGVSMRKGAPNSLRDVVIEAGGTIPQDYDSLVQKIGEEGGTPIVVAENNNILGIVYLKDIIKPGMRERFDRLRAMGIRTVMVTGDNPHTAAAIAREAGVDHFLAEATPQKKIDLIKEEQQKGHLVAMTGDGTNDAPALAQADLGVAMNSGTQAAKEAANMVDLDSNPTKLIEVIEIGKQLLITRGCLTTFSLANDIAKYFAIIPAIFSTAIPVLNNLNVMHLTSPQSAILSAIIFNALIIVGLIPVALKGVNYRPLGATALLIRSLLIYGGGGILIPFIGIKLIDMTLNTLGLV